MKTIKFLHSDGGDWIGLYIDDKLVDEGHSIPEERLAEILLPKAKILSVYAKDELEEYGNRCPQTWPKEYK